MHSEYSQSRISNIKGTNFPKSCRSVLKKKIDVVIVPIFRLVVHRVTTSVYTVFFTSKPYLWKKCRYHKYFSPNTASTMSFRNIVSNMINLTINHH